MKLILDKLISIYHWILEKIKNKVSLKWIIMGVGIFILLLVIIWAFANKRYYRYKVLDSQVLENGNHTYYDSFADYIIKYNQDGIALSNFKGKVSFNGTYEMNNPILVKSQKHFAILDQEGTKAYLYNAEGEVIHFQTPLPIIKGEVSDSGILVLLLNGGNTTWIHYYNRKGDLLAESKTTMEESGYPLDMAISNEGSVVGVSFVQVANAQLKSRIVFYNFSKGGQSQLNYVVNEVTYPETLVSDIEFIGRGRYVAFSDQGFSIFEGRERPKEIKKVSVVEEIKSVICEAGYIGIIANDLENNQQILRLFNSDGQSLGNRLFDDDFIHIRHNADSFITFGNQYFSVYRSSGKIAFKGEYRFPIKQIIQGNAINELLIVGDNYLERVRLN